VRNPVLERKIREWSGGVSTEARLKMAEVPEGAELVYAGDSDFPTVTIRNIFILPGIPEIFRAKIEALKSRLAVDPYFLRVVYLRALESTLAPYLNATLEAFPELLLGSYPTLNDPEYRVRVTLESKDQAYVERALSHLLAQLQSDIVVRTE